MILSPISLQNYFFEELSFHLDPAFDTSTSEREQVLSLPLPTELLRVQVELAVQEVDKRARVYRLQISSDAPEGRLPVTFRACVIGHFQIDAECPDEAVEKVSDANAPALLYGVAREALAALTGRSPWPPLCLPAVHFLDLNFASTSGEDVSQLRSIGTEITTRKKPKARKTTP